MVSTNTFKNLLISYTIHFYRYFGKVSGILGTINNEQFDDMTQSDNTVATIEEIFVDSWKIQKACSNTNIVTANSSSEPNSACGLFFKHKTSYFSTCFSIVNPDPFYKICLNLNSPSLYQNLSSSLQNACTAAAAYIMACSMENVPLRIPDSCIQ